jgi:hypothetical protein
MKTPVTVLALTAMAITSALAQAPSAAATRSDIASIRESYAPGNQTVPDPDRDFDGQYARHVYF